MDNEGVADDYDDYYDGDKGRQPSFQISQHHSYPVYHYTDTYILEYNRSIRNDETHMYISA